MRTLITAAALLAVPSLALAADSVDKTIYSCADNATMQVAYVNTDAGNSFAILLEQDELIPMKQVVSASGAVYQAINPDYTYQLLTKGKTADLVAVTNGKEETVKKDCTAE